jgi:Na+/melibiose symporter-like transporter
MLISDWDTNMTAQGEFFSVFAIFVGVIGGGLFLLAFFGTKERTYSEEKAPSFKEMLQYLLTNKPHGRIILSNMFGFMRPLLGITSMFVATYVFEAGALNIVIVGAFGVAQFVGMFLTPYLTKRFDNRRLYLYCSLAGAAVCFAGMLFGRSLIGLTACVFFAAIPLGIEGNVRYAIVAESVDYVEYLTGKRTEGVTVSMQTFMSKMGTTLQTTFFALLLILISFVQPEETEVTREILNDAGAVINTVTETILVPQPQPESALNGLAYTATLLPAIGWLLGAIPFLGYDFIGKKREHILAEVIRRRDIRASGDAAAIAAIDAEIARQQAEAAAIAAARPKLGKFELGYVIFLSACILAAMGYLVWSMM